jgi:hypothetical protein
MRWAGVAVLMSVVVVAGCQRKAAEGPVAPVPVGADARARIARLAPGAAIGTVIAVLAEDRLVAVGEVQVRDFHVGDVVSFMGGEEQPIGTGVVVNIVRDTLHVRYEASSAVGRAPVVGDLAVRFKR